jgi:hypothetical protein
LKTIEYKLGCWEVDWMFSPLRTKNQVIELLMKSIKLMLVGDQLEASEAKGKMVLVVSKMSRLFFFTENKYFSITFPFYVSFQDSKIYFSSKGGLSIDNKVTSEVLSIINNKNSFNSDNIYALADSVLEIADYNNKFWPLIRDLLMYEDGYIRYDIDPKHENQTNHPLNHIDLFYSSNATFKLGLRTKANNAYFMNLLDITCQCNFLES